ncbi:NAD(P)/FAD-dependent oxidoreductase [Prauserella cavernicola]|uniref:FAD-binding oxidoreductase n=1 Tax=Prauserella cavernicola TaxID=2800127 RepID=A0A934V314_9PSEU|nr:FAD-dependent oxidoreductase [Prauserella cavernicola]MBK1783777.1 FAD-binding oxidoreductase [Prauserella cavernicola]
MHSAVVIGAGVVGSTIAATLAARGHAVTVLDAGEPGSAVSEASFAWVNAHHGKRPVSYRELNRRGLRVHHRWHREGRAPWFFPTGALTVAGDRGGGEKLRAELESAAETGEQLTELSGAQLRRRFPDLGPDVDHASFNPDEGWVDTRRLIAHQLAAASGAEVRTSCPVTRVLPRPGGDGVEVHTADGGVHEFDSVVVAAGNGSAPLLHSLAPTPLLTTGSADAKIGMTLETEPLDVAPPTVFKSPDVSIRPAPGGRAVIADHATAANFRHDDPDLWTLPRTLLARAATIMPALASARIARVRVSERVMPVDGLPVVGRVAPGVLTVLTHSGVTLAPLLSELVADGLDADTPPGLVDYRPDRF